jgi:xanthine dehydrogenase accessory factor
VGELSRIIARWRAEGLDVAIATVISVDGSAPRDPGAKLLVSGDGRLEGSVSGGCVEAAVAQEARSVLDTGQPKIVRYGINKNMMWDVGLSCGGAIDVFIERLGPNIPPFDGAGATLCTIVRGPSRVGERFCVTLRKGREPSLEGDATGQFRASLIDAAAGSVAALAAQVVAIGAHHVFVDPQFAPSPMIIVGAVHIAVALCDAASNAGFSVTIVDPRARLCNRDRFPAADRLIVGWPEDELPKLDIDADTSVAVLTHDEKFDDPTLDFVLRRDVRYVGAIGSKKTQALRRARLIDAGIAPAAIDRLRAPIGLDIGANTPEEIAIAILAEMIAAKYDRSGAPLRDRAAPRIHA